MLPLAKYYSSIKQQMAIMTNSTAGQMARRVVIAIKSVIKSYVIFVDSVDKEFRSGAADLQKLRYLTQDSVLVLEEIDKFSFNKYIERVIETKRRQIDKRALSEVFD